MKTSSTPLDPRRLSHRLTTVGHTLHHRLIERLRDAEIDPRSVAILRTVAGELDAPWIAARIARGGTRVRALADRGWIVLDADAETWHLTDDGRAILDRVDAGTAALREGLSTAAPEADLDAFVTTLDALAAALGVDESEHRMPFGPRGRHGSGPHRPFGREAFGPGARPGFGRSHGCGELDGNGRETGDDSRHAGFGRGHHDGGRRTGFGRSHGDGGQRFGRGPRHGDGDRGHRAAQRAYERGFDAGFSRGRESSASA